MELKPHLHHRRGRAWQVLIVLYGIETEQIALTPDEISHSLNRTLWN